ncbi:hypothetical protein WAF17_11170 [Bernardetia sp. ABR2-2B]|uniref:hypothetical protein n=1 Tax=Bernardetia sp. ABR2-2B TaxID=3127472 RepID=UPI0030D3FC1E
MKILICRFLIFSLVLLVNFPVFGQQKDTTQIEETKIYTIAENRPIFEGGQDNFYKIISKNLKLAEKSNVTGSRVFIEFVIDTTGKMTDFKILKSNFSKKNNEGFLKTLDSISENYTWKPAVHKGKKVFYRMSLPIILRLSE